jgi:hypothetical protein
MATCLHPKTYTLHLTPYNLFQSMPINKNHEFEELNGVKCAIVERNVVQERVDFLNDLLTLNRYTVVIVASPPPKAVKPATSPTEPSAEAGRPPAPTFTVGVTDVTFNSTNAIFGRLLKTKEGAVVTLAYWQQKESTSNDEVPYFDKKF